jgi:chorismate mutase/prephenate dehydrogenase
MILEQLRDRLSQVDRELISLIAERQRIVAEIGEHKIQTASPTRDYARERIVLDGAREQAEQLGLDPDVAERIMLELIRTSLTHQERSRVAARNSGAGKRALIIGGAGKMGGWFARFLTSQGYAVEIADPDPTPSEFERIADWQDSDLTHELIVVATPIGVSRQILRDLAQLRPEGVIFDLGSLKTPLRDGLQALVDAGCKVTSLHPMFGPDTRLLSERHVVLIDLGSEQASAYARDLFDSTMASLVEMSVDEHDRLIAYVLGLSHAVNLAFFTALADSGEYVRRLMTMSSTTFNAQVDVARSVALDNPHLYFEIQSLNEFGAESLHALRAATTRIIELVAAGDEDGFVELMLSGREYVAMREEGSQQAAAGNA